MTIVTVVCLMIWTGMLPVPDPGFSEKEKPTAEAQPCPPADAVTSKIVSIPVNVYNGTDSAGLASTVADVLTDAGMTVGATTDWPRGTYEGDVLITSSEAGLTNAYTLSRAFSGTVTVRIDENTDAADTTVSVVLGSEYEHTILTSGEIGQLAAGQPITAPAIVPIEPMRKIASSCPVSRQILRIFVWSSRSGIASGTKYPQTTSS